MLAQENGELVLRSGQHVPLNYDMVDTGSGRRSGHLTFDISALDPAAFFEVLELRCEDGSKVRIAVTHYSDRHASFVGQITT